MSLVQDNHVVQQIPSATLDPAFRDTYDEKAIQNTKRERWHCEKVHRSNCLTMIPEER
jgi:hypothetical protein